ncbi:MAG: fused MFS/spermidine synthase [Desulfarculus sp.]|nr:fused MFS/spermidine synthase [Desulfarculus sp.]
MSARFLAWTVYFIAFVSGAVVMAFEILGSRVLAPFFGNSIFVWGSLISVFMLGLAAGYYAGGVLSSRGSSFKGLALLLFAPALLISFFPIYAWPICEWLFELDLGQRLGPLFASLFLFTLPTAFLGTVSPYTVQLLVRDHRLAGQGAGNLYAIGTCGSILGTIGTSFFLILWLGTKASMTLLGTVLLFLVVAAWGCQMAAARQEGKKD